MSDDLMKQFRDRWQAVESVERQEQQTASIEMRWQQMNAIFRLAFGLKIKISRSDENEEVVWQRWAKLKGIQT